MVLFLRKHDHDQVLGSVVGGSVVGLHFLSCLLGGDTLSFLLPLYTFIVVALHVHSCGPISEKNDHDLVLGGSVVGGSVVGGSFVELFAFPLLCCLRR